MTLTYVGIECQSQPYIGTPPLWSMNSTAFGHTHEPRTREAKAERRQLGALLQQSRELSQKIQ
jgi:hypothetical protein